MSSLAVRALMPVFTGVWCAAVIVSLVIHVAVAGRWGGGQEKAGNFVAYSMLALSG